MVRSFAKNIVGSVFWIEEGAKFVCSSVVGQKRDWRHGQDLILLLSYRSSKSSSSSSSTDILPNSTTSFSSYIGTMLFGFFFISFLGDIVKIVEDTHPIFLKIYLTLRPQNHPLLPKSDQLHMQ